LVPFTAKLFIVSQQSDMQCSILQGENCHGSKTFLTEEVILPELLSDNLSHVPMIFLIIARVTAMFLCERGKLCGWKKYSDSETSSEESDIISHVGATMWVKEDIMPNLGPFT
jgi:hypothetical protein